MSNNSGSGFRPSINTGIPTGTHIFMNGDSPGYVMTRAVIDFMKNRHNPTDQKFTVDIQIFFDVRTNTHYLNSTLLLPDISYVRNFIFRVPDGTVLFFDCTPTGFNLMRGKIRELQVPLVNAMRDTPIRLPGGEWSNHDTMIRNKACTMRTLDKVFNSYNDPHPSIPLLPIEFHSRRR